MGFRGDWKEISIGVSIFSREQSKTSFVLVGLFTGRSNSTDGNGVYCCGWNKCSQAALNEVDSLDEVHGVIEFQHQTGSASVLSNHQYGDCCTAVGLDDQESKPW